MWFYSALDETLLKVAIGLLVALLVVCLLILYKLFNNSGDGNLSKTVNRGNINDNKSLVKPDTSADTDDEEVVAVITATLMAYYDCEGENNVPPFRIRKITLR